MILDVLVAEGKARRVGGLPGETMGLDFSLERTPTLADMMELARELDAQGSQVETPLRFLLGDTIAAIERLPGITKRKLIDTTFVVFGDNAYHRLRKYAHVANAYPFDTMFADGTPRRRTDVGWCVLQELAPDWIRDDFRQEKLAAAARGKITIQQIRCELKKLKRENSISAASSTESVQEQTTSTADCCDVPASEQVPLSPSKAPWEEEYARIVSVPALIPAYEIASDVRSILNVLILRANMGSIINLFLIGETGCGKTSLARQFAAETGRRFFLFNCGTVRSEAEWWGVREADNGRTFFCPSALVYALSQGNVVIVLDEINRVPAHLLNPLMNLMDDTRATMTPSGQYVQVAPGTIIFGTANLGEGGYIGTYSLDAAFLNRLGTILHLPPPAPQTMKVRLDQDAKCGQETSSLLVKFVAKIKDALPTSKVGMRQMLEAAAWIVNGTPVRQACQITIIEYCTLENPSCRQIVENILDGLLRDAGQLLALPTRPTRKGATQ